MATDHDRYGTKLGRQFRTVRALLCSPDESRLGVAKAAEYLERRLTAEMTDLSDLLREGQKIVRSRQGWLLDDADIPFKRFEAVASRSLGACHLVDSVRDAINGNCDPNDVLSNLVSRAVDGIVACAHTQRDYAADKELHRALNVNRASVEADLTRRLRRRLYRSEVHARIVDTRTGDQAGLLDLVIARATDVRAR